MTVVNPTPGGGTSPAPAPFSIPQGNRAPTANAGGPYGVVAGGSITLSGSGSDPDNDPLTYAWDLDNDGTFETTGQSPTFSAAGLSAGTSRMVVREVCDNKNLCIRSAPATVNVLSALRITTESPLPSGTVGVAYSTRLSATGGTEPYTWTIASGELPPGLALNGSTGVISGTPTGAGTYAFTVRVTDSSQVTATKQFTLSSPPTEGTPGQPYPPTPVQPVPPTPPGGGEAPPCTNYMLAAGSDLPPGMRLDPVTGTLSGTPTSGGSFKIVVECTYNANQTATADFTITILNPKPAIQSVSPNSATAGGPALTLTVNGNGFVNATDPTKASVVQWNGTSRKTTFVSATQLTAEIGTADVAAAGTAKVTVVNPAPGGGTSNELSFTITQATPTNRPPVAKAGADQAIKEGETVTLNAGESSDPDADALSHKWTLVSHSGPDVSLSSATAASPTFATTDNGSYTFRVEVSDGKGGTATDEVVVTVTNVAPTVKAGADAALCSGQTLGLKADVADPGAKDGPWSFSIDWGDGSPSNTGSSPSQGTGVVTGSHQYFAAKTYTVKVCVTDKDGGQHCDELKLEIKTAAAELGEIRDELAAIVRENPRTPLADKIEDALAKVEVALTELNKRPPDRVAAVGNVEGAVGDLEAAVKDRLLAAAEGRPLMDCLAGTARLLAQTALDEAVARSGNRSAFEEARRSLARGDERRAAGAFKEAVAVYKDALSKATGA